MIGGYDPMAMPAPPQIMIFLLGLTFVLHLAFLGLLFSSLWARIGAEWGKSGSYDSLRVHRAGVVGFSMTITLGVPPLLFVQILYGQYFYSSSISIGFPWLAVVGYLLVGFYAMYLAQWSWTRQNRPSAMGKSFLLLSILCILAIGFTYSWNHLKSLSETPWTNDVSHATALHRLSGYFGSALMASAAWAAWFGPRWRADCRMPKGVGWAASLGGLSLLTWALTSEYAAAGGLGLDRPLLLTAAITGIVAGALATVFHRSTVAKWLITLAAPFGMLGLLVQRELYRLEVMSPFYSPFAEQVRTQWSAVALFAVTFILGLVVLLWLFVQVRRVPPAATHSS